MNYYSLPVCNSIAVCTPDSIEARGGAAAVALDNNGDSVIVTGGANRAGTVFSDINVIHDLSEPAISLGSGHVSHL